MDQTIRDARIFIQRRIAEGFDEPWEIVEGLLELHQDAVDDQYELRALAYEMVDEALQAHFREQLQWEDLTDCDKLDSAFAELNSHNIVARQHFTWTQRQGHEEILEEIDEVRYRYGLDPVGYVFYHMQDTENAYLYGTLYLAFGAVDGDELSTLLIAHRILDALENAGLQTEWDGNLRNRIRVVNLDWKRRRVMAN